MYYFKAKYFCCTLYMYWIKMVIITYNKSLKLADSLSYHLEWYASPSLLTCYSSSDLKRKLYWILLITWNGMFVHQYILCFKIIHFLHTTHLYRSFEIFPLTHILSTNSSNTCNCLRTKHILVNWCYVNRYGLFVH
jgi:hypothetical protein